MEATTAPLNAEALADAARFSSLDLRDPVVIMALFDQLVTEPEIEALWQVWRLRHLPFRREPFWRLMLLLPNVDANLLFQQAARVGGVEEARLNRHAVFKAIRNVKRDLSRPAWKTLTEVPVVPVDEQGYGREGKTIILATEDPTQPRVVKLVEDTWTGGPYELRYASSEDLLALLEEERDNRLTTGRR